MDPALIFFFSLKFQNPKYITNTIPNIFQSKNPKLNPKSITNTIRNVPGLNNILSYFGPKKNRAGGVLRERGLGTYTSPTLGFNKAHLLYSTRKKDKKDQF